MRERGLIAKSALAGLLVVLYAPLVFLVVASINQNPASTHWDGFTTRWYRNAFHDPTLRHATGVSLRLAAGAALAATVLGTAAAVAVRRTRWLSRLATALAGLRVATPEIIIATGLGALLPVLEIGFGFRPMLVAHAAYLSAYVMLVVGARAAGADPVLEETAMDLGAGRARVLRRVVLPDLAPAIVSAGLLAFAFSFDDVALSLALRGPNDTTLPLYVYSAVQRRVTPVIHAVGALVIAAGVIVFLVAVAVNRSIVRAGARHRS